MNITLPDISKITREVKKLFFVLRNDKEAQVQARTMLLGIIVCLALNYSTSTLFLAPMEKTLNEKIAQQKEIKAASPEQLTAAMTMAVQKLDQQKLQLDKKITVLQLKKNLLREHWEAMGNEERFSKIIFTLLPNAPINIEKELNQVTMAERRSRDAFDLHPMSLVGDAAFPDLFNYLKYIESRPEIGSISRITIESLPTKRYDLKAKVHFNIMVSRLSLKGTI